MSVQVSCFLSPSICWLELIDKMNMQYGTVSWAELSFGQCIMCHCEKWLIVKSTHPFIKYTQQTHAWHKKAVQHEFDKSIFSSVSHLFATLTLTHSPPCNCKLFSWQTSGRYTHSWTYEQQRQNQQRSEREKKKKLYDDITNYKRIKILNWCRVEISTKYVQLSDKMWK